MQTTRRGLEPRTRLYPGPLASHSQGLHGPMMRFCRPFQDSYIHLIPGARNLEVSPGFPVSPLSLPPKPPFSPMATTQRCSLHPRTLNSSTPTSPPPPPPHASLNCPRPSPSLPSPRPPVTPRYLQQQNGGPLMPGGLCRRSKNSGKAPAKLYPICHCLAGTMSCPLRLLCFSFSPKHP